MDNTLINYAPAYRFLVAEVLDDRKYEYEYFDKDSAKKLIVEKKGNEVWTKAQGKLYSRYLTFAELFPGALEFLDEAKKKDLDLKIVSHKTRYPYAGERVDLQACAKEWLNNRLPSAIFAPTLGENVFFEESKEEKVRRIVDLGCELFIDDLKEILHALPSDIARIHFRGSTGVENILTVSSWAEVSDLLR